MTIGRRWLRRLAPTPLLLGVTLLQVPAVQHTEDHTSRDGWQRPDAVMDALGIRRGSAVADIGAGSGYFTFHLARRVGPTGKVYAVDLVPSALADIAARAKSQKLPQIATVHGSPGDPSLPASSVDVVLVVNTYHEFTVYDAMVVGFAKALKPGGLLAVIDAEALPDESPTLYARHHRIPSRIVRDEAERNGFRFVREELGFLDPAAAFYERWFFLVFRK